MYEWVVALGVLAVVAVVAFIISRPGYQDQRSQYPKLAEISANYAAIDPAYGNIPIREGSSAYTENKSIITICLKDPTSGHEYDMNTLMYVALHELAHATNPEEGHGEMFRARFQELLKRGYQLGFYNPNIPMPPAYCGVKAS